MTSYRQNNVEMLIPESTYIKSDIDGLNVNIVEAKEKLISEARTLAVLSSGLLGVITGVLVSQLVGIYIGLAVFLGMFAGSAYVCCTKIVIDRISKFRRFRHLNCEISACEEKIESLKIRAKQYQKTLEPEGYPGFMSVYSDILVHKSFSCSLPKDEILSISIASSLGNASDIDPVIYGLVLQSLKSFDFATYQENTAHYLDGFRPQSRFHACMEAAFLVSQYSCESDPISEKLILVCNLGLNAWYYAKVSGGQETWTNLDHRTFEIAREVFRSVLSENRDRAIHSEAFMAAWEKMEKAS